MFSDPTDPCNAKCALAVAQHARAVDAAARRQDQADFMCYTQLKCIPDLSAAARLTRNPLGAVNHKPLLSLVSRVGESKTRIDSSSLFGYSIPERDEVRPL